MHASSIWKNTKQLMKGAEVMGMVLALLITTIPLETQAADMSRVREQEFTQAAAEFKVPKELLMAISYNQTRWENHKGQPSVSGGYGLMHLTDQIELKDGRGDPQRPAKPRQSSVQSRTLLEAAQLLNVPADTLKKDDNQNVRGSAALLAHYAKSDNNGQLPGQLSAWYGAAARLAGAKDNEAAQAFADDVYKTIQTGMVRTTGDGQTLGISPQAVEPDRSKLGSLNLPSSKHKRNQSGAECPITLNCTFTPARFAQNDPQDPVNYGNYDTANRPHDMKIKYIVIHDTEGSYQSAINWFQDPSSFVAAHYVIRSSDGAVTQMVKNKDVGWHAGNWYMNMHSIGVEHEAIAAEGATWYTEAMYRSSAKLVRYLAEKYDIPLDREHIVGHDQYHAPTPDRVQGMHYDPGPYWDWEHYMRLLYAPIVPNAVPQSNVVTIAPKFDTNKPTVTQCQDGVCSELPQQSANFIYLRSEPHHDAPLLRDPGRRPDGSPGTTEISDWSAKATYGQRFAVAERQAEWTAIWFGGQKGWFHSSQSWYGTALPTKGSAITPRNGLASIPIYGRPLPEPSAYPSGGPPVQPIVSLQYEIPAGQTYVAYDKRTPTDHFHALTFNRSTPGDGVTVVGTEKYIPISYNHRQAYVKASDVTLVDN